ncbi:MAG: hypothetical protein J7L83_04105, partial [Thaumarchaeota archaeon]|nr:hypothetical protein [Nitrososphaerota archaeon]
VASIAVHSPPDKIIDISANIHLVGREMRGRSNLRRKAISVMFMIFIAISILSAVFITMYLYLLRASTMDTEAERLYAEAAQ